MKQILSVLFVVLSSSFAFAAGTPQLDLSGARLSSEWFRPSEYQVFEKALLRTLIRKCPRSSGVYNSVLKNTEVDLYVQWTDFVLVNENGEAVLDVSATFDDSSYGLSLRQIDSAKVISCK